MHVFEYPSLVSIFVTNACNLRCRHCCLESGGNEHAMSTEQLRLVIDKVADAGLVCLDFSGGEPFLRPDMCDLVEYAFTRGIRSISVASNMLALDGRARDRLLQLQDDHELLFLRVSLDGATKETHEWLRGPGTFQRAVARLGELQSAGVNVRELNTVVSKRNYDELEDVVALAARHGVRCQVFLPLIPVGRAEEIEREMISPQQWRALCERKDELEERYEIEVFADSPVSTTLDPANYGKSLPCMCGHQFLGVLPNGQFTVCPIVSEGVGNIFEDSLADFWANNALLRDIRDVEALEGKCAGCQFKSMCRGGCRGLAFYYGGGWLKPDPMCWVGEAAG